MKYEKLSLPYCDNKKIYLLLICITIKRRCTFNRWNTLFLKILYSRFGTVGNFHPQKVQLDQSELNWSFFFLFSPWECQIEKLSRPILNTKFPSRIYFIHNIVGVSSRVYLGISLRGNSRTFWVDLSCRKMLWNDLMALA